MELKKLIMVNDFTAEEEEKEVWKREMNIIEITVHVFL